MARQLIVVDVETNGLDRDRHQAVEVAWWNLDTDEQDAFVPAHSVSDVLATADIAALKVNRYLDRIAEAPQDRGMKISALYGQLRDATLVGSNPGFDAAMLRKMFSSWGRADSFEPWHHRMWDLSNVAATVLGLDELPGLAKVCQLLGIPAGDHTAAGDVTATGLCFRALRAPSRSAEA